MKILMVDFDKTLYTDNYQQNVQMLNKFVEAGNKLILATGRNLYNLTPDLDPNLKFSYLVCSDGGIIFDNELNVLYRKDLISEVIKPIYDILKKAPSVGNPLIDVSEKYVNEPVAHANAIVARIIDYAKAQALLGQITTSFPAVSGYLSDCYLNLEDQSVSKGNALKCICNLINYDYQKVYAIGDSQNDISMCTICHGFAVANATAELKDVCIGIVNDLQELVEML